MVQVIFIWSALDWVPFISQCFQQFLSHLLAVIFLAFPNGSSSTFFNVVLHFSDCLYFVVISKTLRSWLVHVIVVSGPISMVPCYHVFFQP